MSGADTGAPEWWTPIALAEAELPGLPTTARRINALADRAGWRSDPRLFRRVAGRGGGWEYHRALLPAEAQAALARRALRAAAEPEAPASPDRVAAWQLFERAPERARAEAARRLAAIQAVEALLAAGASTTVATAHVAREIAASARTIYGWRELVEGVAVPDRLAILLPRTALRGPSPRRAEIDPAFAAMVRDDWLRPSKPSLRSAYDRQVPVAEAEGVAVAGYKAIQRWMKREVSRDIRVLRREGVEALKRLYPAQQRDKTALRALEAVNGDVHRFDVFVRWPAGPDGREDIVRPQMVCFQDVYSGLLLAWRVDRTPNAATTRLCIGDMIEDHGIPEQVVLDNGREFAAKEISGGAANRYRFQIREDDTPGLLTQLGCNVRFTQPYSGQSKPIERAFRDLCDRVAKDPRFEGAYTGNSPMAKPENYGSRAVPLEQFLLVLAEGIAAHNMREGRRSEVACGRSFAEVYRESYARGPIRKATAEQRRLWLMGAEGLRAHSRTGEIKLMDNRYWADWLTQHAGQTLVARFDPAALWDGIHVYDAQGRSLGFVPCMQKVGFFDVDEGRLHQKARRDYLNAVKRAEAAQRRMEATEIGAKLTALAPAPLEAPETKVVTPVFDRRPAARPASEPSPEERATQTAIVEELAARRRPEPAPVDEERETFRRALELVRAREGGEALTREQERWLAVYTQSAAWRALSALHEDFGDAMFAGM